MSQRIARTDAKRRKRKSRLITAGWIVGITALIIILLARERADWLYVLATLGLTTLLLIVAFSDLGENQTRVDEAPPLDDSASIGDGLTTTMASPAPVAQSDFRRRKKPRTARK